MKLKQRLNFGYIVVIILMIVSGLLSISALFTLNTSINHYLNGAQRADTAVKICRIDTNIAARNIREMVLNDDKTSYSAYQAKIEQNLAEIETELQALKDSDVVDSQLVQQYTDEIHQWMTVGNTIISEILAGKREAATSRILNECAPALNEVIKTAGAIDKQTDQLRSEVLQSSTRLFYGGIILIVLFVVLAIVLSALISKIVVSSIVNPVQEVEEAVLALSEGNLNSNLEYTSDDELGNLAQHLRESLETLRAYIGDIRHAMREFSNGNFDVDSDLEWKGDFVEIANSFVAFEKNMADTVIGIQQVADQVNSGAEQVAASSTDLADGASEQASITEELTATIAQMVELVSQNSEEAKEISQKVDNTGVEIVNSNAKMNEMILSMNEIQHSSNKISQIIATINDIASQTNLLALNASIEAARAGEAGKGFAVVADQVSILAAQSAEAAKESTVLIESSVKAVKSGMVIADETAKQLENVVASSKVITNEVNMIADALNSQAAAISQINSGVENINDVVQTNSATSEECAAASQEMNSLAMHLESLIRNFKIKKFD